MPHASRSAPADLHNRTSSTEPVPAQLYRLYHRRVRSFLLQRTRDPEVAADLTQDVFEAAVRAGPALERDGKHDGLGWLLTVAQRRFVDEVRRSRDRRPLPPIATQTEISNADGLELQRLLSQLGRREREIFLRRLAGQPFAEIAESTASSAAVCRALHSRACARLRDQLRKDLEDSENASPA